jgi:phosphoribosylformimino-5-aminoimidazole carboxamide ribotide isomerase
MKAIPAIDLREGACVQLVGGRYEDERVRLPDPVAVSRRWSGLGLRTQHLVDLDAATGRGNNRETIATLAHENGLTLQVGGGVREADDITRLVDLGIDSVVVGTRAIEDPPWLEEMAARFPQRLVLAADVRERTVLTRGWQVTTTLSIQALLQRVAALPLAGVLVTAVHVEGQLKGIDRALFTEVARVTSLPVIASGGVTSMEDLRALEAAGARGAVIGMALYTGALDGAALAREFKA